MSERRCLFFAYSISNFAPPAAIKRCCFVELCDPLLTQNGIGAGRSGRKQRKIRRVNGGKKHKAEPKRLRFALETTYGPEGRGFESLTACQFQEPGNRNGFPALSIFLKGFGVIYFFIVLQDPELNLQNIHPNYL